MICHCLSDAWAETLKQQAGSLSERVGSFRIGVKKKKKRVLPTFVKEPKRRAAAPVRANGQNQKARTMLMETDEHAGWEEF